MSMRRSVLFLLPDYHNSFTLASKFRERGWRAEVFVPAQFAERFLFSQDVIRQWRFPWSGNRFWTLINLVVALVQYAVLCIRFRTHVVYGRLHHPNLYEFELYQAGVVSEGFSFGLTVARLLYTKQVFIPSGCRDEDLKEVYEGLEGESMCGNCGYYDSCNDKDNRFYMQRAIRYADRITNWGFHGSTVLTVRPFRYKCLDFSRWTVPDRSARERIVVLHSHATESRNLMPGRNIKGTPTIDAVMERICARHPNVEYRCVTGLKPAEMLQQQQDADILIDQLHYGYWGSTGIEAMGVGCAVVCYLRPAWIDHFKNTFPAAPDIPVVSATKDSLEEVMEGLVNDRARLRVIQRRSREFAEAFYGPDGVADEVEAVLSGLQSGRTTESAKQRQGL